MKRSEFDADVTANLITKRAKRGHNPPLTAFLPCAKRRSVNSPPHKPRPKGKRPIKPPAPAPEVAPEVAPEPSPAPDELELLAEPAPGSPPTAAEIQAPVLDKLANGQVGTVNLLLPVDKTSKPLSYGRQPWTSQLDALLCFHVAKISEDFCQERGFWTTIAEQVPTKNAKQCRERWVNNLDPNLAADQVTEAELEALLGIFAQTGPRWACAAGHLNAWRMRKNLKGVRSDSQIKNLVLSRRTLFQPKPPEQPHVDHCDFPSFYHPVAPEGVHREPNFEQILHGPPNANDAFPGVDSEAFLEMIDGAIPDSILEPPEKTTLTISNTVIFTDSDGTAFDGDHWTPMTPRTETRKPGFYLVHKQTKSRGEAVSELLTSRTYGCKPFDIHTRAGTRLNFSF